VTVEIIVLQAFEGLLQRFVAFLQRVERLLQRLARLLQIGEVVLLSVESGLFAFASPLP